MARSVADLAIRLGLNAKPVFDTVDSVNSKLSTLGRSGAGVFGHMGGGSFALSAAGAGAGAAVGVAAAGAALSAITGAAESAVEGVTSLVGGVIRLTQGAAESGLAFDRQKTSLRQLTATAEDANSIFDRMAKLSAQGGGKLETLLQTARSFVAAGQSADVAARNVEAVGVVSKIFGADMDRVGIALSQMLGKGVVQMEELRGQLLEAGIPLTFFTDQLGLTVEQFMHLQEQGRVTGDTLLWAFRRATDEGGKFSGAMDAVGASASGTWDRFLGKLDLVRGRIGLSIINTVNEAWASSPFQTFDVDAIAARFENWFAQSRGSLTQVFRITSDIFNLSVDLFSRAGRHLGTWNQIEERLRSIREGMPAAATASQKFAMGFVEAARWANFLYDRLRMIADVMSIADPTRAIAEQLAIHVGKFGQSGLELHTPTARAIDAELRDLKAELKDADWGAVVRRAMDTTNKQAFDSIQAQQARASAAAFGVTGAIMGTPPKPGTPGGAPLKTPELAPRGDWERLSAAVLADKAAGRSEQTGRAVLDAFNSFKSQNAGAGSVFGGDARSVAANQKFADAMNRQGSTNNVKVVDVLRSQLDVQRRTDQTEREILKEIRKLGEQSPAAFAAPQGLTFKGAGG
jgi:tape measure domain-containing protein